MNASTSRLPEMINSSIAVLTRPSIQTFEMYERRGTMRDALVYVALAAAVAGIVAFVFGLLGGIGSAIASLIGGILIPLVSFFVFAYALFFMGKQQGGTGTQDEVFYTCALYTAPLLAITGAVSNIPLLGCLLLPVTLLLGLYQLYLGYLASRASMNIDSTKAIISVVVAIIAQIVVGSLILGAIITAVFAGVRA